MFSKIPEFYQGHKVFWVEREKIKRIVPASKTFVPKLKIDILKNGMLYPLTLESQEKMRCLTGNQRLKVLEELGIKNVPVIFFLPLVPIPKKLQNVTNRNIVTIRTNVRFLSGKERIKKKRKKRS